MTKRDDHPITWEERMHNLRKALGRRPTLEEMLDVVHIHIMTPEETESQRQSWIRAMRSTGDPRFD